MFCSKVLIDMLNLKFIKICLGYILFASATLFILFTFVNYVEFNGNSIAGSPRLVTTTTGTINLLQLQENTNDVNEETLESKPTIKMILLWNEFYRGYNYMFRMDGKQFVSGDKCPEDNCIVTSDRNLRPIEMYDAVVMHCWHSNITTLDIPKKRNPFQYYAFVSLEAPFRNKVDNTLDDLFNWTITYRFDSDFMWPIYKVKDKNGNVVSPAEYPHWHNEVHELSPPPTTKTKKVAWHVSHCKTDSLREVYIKKLQEYVEVDIYGRCGPLKCPLDDNARCMKELKRDYFFYVAFENSHCQDYITEKPFNALMYDTIPIVYGLANYSQFLPPNSYLDANNLTPEQLANRINYFVDNPEEYAKFFWWKGQYTYHNVYGRPNIHPFCEMCKALNTPNLPRKTYHSLKEWWHGTENYSVCVKPNVTDDNVLVLREPRY